MNTELKGSILNRIRKMLALAKDAGASDGERDNAMRMVHSTLAKYNLSMVEAEAAGVTNEDDKRTKLFVQTQNYPWMRRVGMGLGELFFCKYFYTESFSGNKVSHFFIGRESNTLTASEMLQYITKSIWKEANAGQKAAPWDRHYWTSFCNGAAVQIYHRCVALRIEAEKASAAPVMSSGTSLVLASVYESERKANEEFLSKVLGITLTASKGRTVSRSDAYYEGQSFGDRVSLNTQVSSAASTRNLIK